MRLGLRRGASTPSPGDPGDSGDLGDSGDQGDQGRGDDLGGVVVADFATLVEGRWLWVAVPAQTGFLALRRVEDGPGGRGGQVVEAPAQTVTDQPRHLAARLDLAVLDGVEARYDVVVVGPDGTVRTVASAPRPAGPAGRPGPDGRTQHTLVRSPEGRLRVRTTLPAPAAGLLAARRLDEAVELTLSASGPELAILDEAGTTALASWPVDAHGVVTLTPASIAHLGATTRPAVTWRDGAWVGVRRRANDLLDPRSGAPLPQLDHPTEDRPRLRLPWSRDALLQVRIFDLEPTPGDAPAEPTP